MKSNDNELHEKANNLIEQLKKDRQKALLKRVKNPKTNPFGIKKEEVENDEEKIIYLRPFNDLIIFSDFTWNWDDGFDEQEMEISETNDFEMKTIKLDLLLYDGMLTEISTKSTFDPSLFKPTIFLPKSRYDIIIKKSLLEDICDYKDNLNNNLEKCKIKFMYSYIENYYSIIQEEEHIELEWQNIRLNVIKRDNNKCVLCGDFFANENFEVHHIKQRSQGGDDEYINLVSLCKHCHATLPNHEIVLSNKVKDNISQNVKILEHISKLNPSIVIENIWCEHPLNPFIEYHDEYGFILLAEWQATIPPPNKNQIMKKYKIIRNKNYKSKIEMIKIPSGSFVMGSNFYYDPSSWYYDSNADISDELNPASKNWLRDFRERWYFDDIKELYEKGWLDSFIIKNYPLFDEIPIHFVEIDELEISSTPITQAQYEKITGQNPSEYKGNNLLPVYNVTWNETAKFCNLLSEYEGLEKCYNENTWECNFMKNGFRLPTEAEWEYACRSGTSTEYYNGNDINNVNKIAWFVFDEDKLDESIQPVAKKEPNAWGLFDMLGNVCEWCNDYYEERYYENSPIKNPHCSSNFPNSDFNNHRVLRGGDLYCRIEGVRCAHRLHNLSNNTVDPDGDKIIGSVRISV